LRAAGAIDGLAVAVTGPHGMPDDVRTAADITLAGPSEAARMLAFLARALRRESIDAAR
jgi:hypothetical protein